MLDDTQRGGSLGLVPWLSLNGNIKEFGVGREEIIYKKPRVEFTLVWELEYEPNRRTRGQGHLRAG